MKTLVTIFTTLTAALAFAAPVKSTATSGKSFWDYKSREAVAGIRINKSAPPSGVSGKDKMAFQGGVYAYLPVNENFSLRTGGLFVMRDAEGTFGGVTFTGTRTFVDLPAHAVFTPVKNLALIAGFDLGLKIASSCSPSGCTMQDEKTMVLQPVLGADYAVNSMYKFGFSYELETNYHKDWNQSAMIFTGAYTF